MKIRKEQMQAFSDALEEAFVQRMVRHLRRGFSAQLAAQGLYEADLCPLVRRGISRAKAYGVVCEGALEQYLEYMVLLGLDFDRDKRIPWASELLHRQDTDGGRKMAQIAAHLTFSPEGLLQ